MWISKCTPVSFTKNNWIIGAESPLTLAFWCEVFLVTPCTGDKQNIQDDHLVHCREGEENYFANGENSSFVSYEADSDSVSNSENCGGSIDCEWFLPNIIINDNCERLFAEIMMKVWHEKDIVCIYIYIHILHILPLLFF